MFICRRTQMFHSGELIWDNVDGDWCEVWEHESMIGIYDGLL